MASGDITLYPGISQPTGGISSGFPDISQGAGISGNPGGVPAGSFITDSSGNILTDGSGNPLVTS